MAYRGHILCRDCKQRLLLGKPLRYSDGRPSTLWLATAPEEGELGKAALRFMAHHLNHDVIVAGDNFIYDMKDLREYEAFEPRGGPSGVELVRHPSSPW